MKKVVLLGDSIRLIGYGPLVPDMLGDEYKVFQSEDNGRYAKYTLRSLCDYRSHMQNADIIHWNNGLWDCMTDLFDDGGMPFTSEAEYVDNMIRIASELLKITPNVIFATTTPANPKYPYIKNELVAHYNNVLTPKLEAMGIRINDLYSIVNQNITDYICDDNLHLSPEGAKICADQIVSMINKIAKTY